MRRLCGQVAVAVCVAASAGCLGGESLGGHPLPAGSGGTGGAAAANGSVGTGGLGSGAEPFCGTVNFVSIGAVVPDVLIVMDRSGSMNDDSNETVCTGGCGPTSKWALASAAIGNLVSTHPSTNWGLAFYGGDDSCDATGGATVDVGPGSAPAIEAALAATAAGGAAPTASGIHNAESYLQSLTDGASRYILLVSDGLLGCAPSNADSLSVAASNAILAALQNVGAPTFVVGLAPDRDTTAVAALNQMAVNGQEAKPGTAASYYTLADLGSQFMPETSPAAGCVISPGPAVAPGTTLAISATMADGEVVAIPQDPTTGWSFTDATESAIALHGTICQGERNGTYTGFTIAYRCDPPLIDTRRLPPADR